MTATTARTQVAPPCPDWCTSGPHDLMTEGTVDGFGSVLFCHDVMLSDSSDISPISVSSADLVDPDGSYTREQPSILTYSVLDLTAAEARDLAARLVKAAEIMESIVGP